MKSIVNFIKRHTVNRNICYCCNNRFSSDGEYARLYRVFSLNSWGFPPRDPKGRTLEEFMRVNGYSSPDAVCMQCDASFCISCINDNKVIECPRCHNTNKNILVLHHEMKGRSKYVSK